jgi:RNA polymerase sigma-54 factor
MPMAELRAALLKEIEINPMLDLDCCDPDSDYIAGGYVTSAADYDLDSIAQRETLEEHLFSQVADIDEKDKSILSFLLGRMDSLGFVAESDETLASSLGVSPTEMAKVRALLGSLDPKGLGSKNVIECLLSQINGSDAGLITLISDHFDDLLAHRYTKIERAMCIDHATLRSLLTRLKMLNFQPAKIFSDERQNSVVPDIILKKIYGKWQIDLNDRYLPKIRMSDNYKSMLLHKDRWDRADRKFFTQSALGAKFLVNALNRRSDMLMKISEVLLTRQLEFFEGLGSLKPLILKELAQILGVHQSTAGRAVRDKYLQSPRGIFCLKYFFSKKIGGPGGELSANALMEKIRRIIANEKKDRPVSDAEVCNILQANGIALTRRAVTKYRNAMKIPPSRHRKFL